MASALTASFYTTTTIINKCLILCITPFAIHVTLRDSSACFNLIRVVNGIWPVAELVVSRHTQVSILYLLIFFSALIFKLIDAIALAAIFFVIGEVVVPTFTALRTVSISAVARGEARSCFSPHKQRPFFNSIRYDRIRFTPLNVADECVGWAADFWALVRDRVGVSIEAVGADGHRHMFIKLTSKRLKIAVELIRYYFSILSQCGHDWLKIVTSIGKELCLDWIRLKWVDQEIVARSIRISQLCSFALVLGITGAIFANMSFCVEAWLVSYHDIDCRALRAPVKFIIIAPLALIVIEVYKEDAGCTIATNVTYIHIKLQTST